MRALARVLLLLLTFSIPWENVILVPGLGTLSKLVGLVAGGAGFIGLATGSRLRWHPFLLAGILFVAWSWASYYWSIDQTATIDRSVQYTQLWVLAVLVCQFAELKFRSKLLQAYVLGAWVAAIATFYGYFQGIEVEYERFAAQGFDPNDLSAYINFAVPMAAYLAVRRHGAALRVLNIAFIPIGLMAVFLTGSRTGIVGTAVAFIFVLLSLRSTKMSWRTFTFTIFGVGAFFAVTLVPPESYLRLATVASEVQTGTLNNRTQIWGAGLETLSQRPLLGVGAGAFSKGVEPILGTPAAPHNAFIAIAAESGVPGLLLWLAMLALLVPRITLLWGTERRFWLIMLLVLLVPFLSLNFEWRKASWLVMGLAASFGWVEGAIAQTRSAVRSESQAGEAAFEVETSQLLR